MPILGFWEELRLNLMKRLANRRCAGLRWKCKVGPRIEKLLKKNAERSHDYSPEESSNKRFQVKGRGVTCASGVNSLHDVNLAARTCTCRRWDLCGLPCPHAIACIFSKGYNPEDFVDECYSQKKYMGAYEPAINPIPGVAEWEVINKPIMPPRYTRGPGRPKMSRNKEPGEMPPAAGTTKLPKIYYSKISCGKCHKQGHNTRTCDRRNQQGSTSQASSTMQQGDANEKGSQNVQQDGNANDEHRMQNAQQCGNSNGHSSQNVRDEEHHEIPSQQSLAKAPFISSQPLPSPLNFSQEIPPVQRSSQPIGSFLASFSMMYTDPVTRRPKKQVAFRNPKNSMSTENASKPIWRP